MATTKGSDINQPHLQDANLHVLLMLGVKEGGGGKISNLPIENRWFVLNNRKLGIILAGCGKSGPVCSGFDFIKTIVSTLIIYSMP